MVDILLDRALVVAPVAQLALDERLAVLSADDGGEPVAESPARTSMAWAAYSALCATASGAFDGNGADGAGNAVALLIENFAAGPARRLD